MTEHQLMQQGVDLMLFGMGTVFVFLSLLVLSTVLMSAFINKFFPEAEKVASPTAAPTISEHKGDEPPPDIIKAIALALEKHRAK